MHELQGNVHKQIHEALLLTDTSCSDHSATSGTHLVHEFAWKGSGIQKMRVFAALKECVSQPGAHRRAGLSLLVDTRRRMPISLSCPRQRRAWRTTLPNAVAEGRWPITHSRPRTITTQAVVDILIGKINSRINRDQDPKFIGSTIDLAWLKSDLQGGELSSCPG